MIAVISADIIGYSSLEEKQANQVLKTLQDFFDKLEGTRSNLGTDFRIKRGDAVQGEISNPIEALKFGLILKAAVAKITFETDDNKKKRPDIDIRIAIGLGEADVIRNKVDESTGSAYINSGRTLDAMKKEKQLFAIKTNNTELNQELETEFKLLDSILTAWNITSAEFIYWTLFGLTETEISKKINTSQSAVNQRKKKAGWSGIEALLKRYEVLIAKELK